MRLLTLTFASLLVIGLSGCSGPTDEPGAEVPTTPGQSEPTESGAPAGGECGGLTTEDLTGIFGVDLQGPEPSTGDSDQDGISWTSTGCDWENDAEELEIDLDISVASDFPDGQVTCVGPDDDDDVTAVLDLGTQAWWNPGDADEAEGELRVCTDDQLVDLEVNAKDGSMTSDELLDRAQQAVRIIVG